MWIASLLQYLLVWPAPAHLVWRRHFWLQPKPGLGWKVAQKCDKKVFFMERSCLVNIHKKIDSYLKGKVLKSQLQIAPAMPDPKGKILLLQYQLNFLNIFSFPFRHSLYSLAQGYHLNSQRNKTWPLWQGTGPCSRLNIHRRSKSTYLFEAIKRIPADLHIHTYQPCQTHINPGQTHAPIPAQAALFCYRSTVVAILSCPCSRLVLPSCGPLFRATPHLWKIKTFLSYFWCYQLLFLRLVCSNFVNTWVFKAWWLNFIEKT